MKGRSKELIARRNKALVKRFHELHNVKKLRYDDVIRKLSLEEFFIAELTIERIIKAEVK